MEIKMIPELLLLLTPFVVDLSERTMTFPDKTVIPIAIGKPATETPYGTFSVNRIVLAPNNSSTGIFGGIGVEIQNTEGTIIGIHGTNDQSSIGNAVSAGCIRVPKYYEAKLSNDISFSSTIIVQP